MDTHEALVKARNYIDNVGWAQQVSSWDWKRETPGGTCASNALCAIGRAGWTDAHRALAVAAGLGPLDSFALFRWNDAPERTKAEVLDAYDRAIAATAPLPEDLDLQVPVAA